MLDAADALDKKMTEVEEALIQTKAKSGEDALNFPIRTMNQMVDLANVVQGSDAAPTAQSFAVYEVLNKQLDVQLAKWKEVQSHELAALNQKMKEANVPGVSIPPAKPNEPAAGPWTQRKLKSDLHGGLPGGGLISGRLFSFLHPGNAIWLR